MVSPALLSTPGSRLIASLLDGLLGLACVMPGLLVLAFGAASDSGVSSVLGGIGVALGVVVAIVVQVRLLKEGQTVGKRQQGLRIVSYPALEPVELGTTLGMRYLVGQVLISAVPILGSFYGLANVLFVFSAERRCLHDHIASTIVVDDAAWQGQRGEMFSGLFTDEGR